MALGAGNVVEAIAKLPWWMRVGLPAVGGAVAGLIARLRATPVQGVSNVMEAVALGNAQLSLRTTLSRVLSSWSAIATGMSIGREGPLIEFGGSLGAALGRVTATSLDRTRVLVAAGTAAGFAAAYNTPFAAVPFVFETMVGIAAPEALLPTVAVGDARGTDVGADGFARFDRSGMIRLVAGGPHRRHVLTLASSDAGLRAYVFTFGP